MPPVAQRYRLLRFLIGILRMAASLIILFACVLAFFEVLVIYGMTRALPEAGIVLGALGAPVVLLIAGSGAFTAAVVAAIAEALRVLIDMEENSRTTANALVQSHQALLAMAQASGQLQQVPQNIRFVADDLQRLQQIIQDMAADQRQIAADTAALKRRIAPTP